MAASPLEQKIIEYVESLDSLSFVNNDMIPAQFRFVLTQSCNQQCFFCHNEGLPVAKTFMDFGLFMKMIDAIQRNKYPQKIRFTGGEPMLHPGLFDFIAYAKQQCPDNNLGMTTNGLLIQKDIDKLVSSQLDSLTISLHSMDRERFKKITNVDGLQLVLDGLILLRKRKFSGLVKINMVVDENNIDEIPLFTSFCQRYGFQLKLLNILPHQYKDLSQYVDNIITTESMKTKLKNLPLGTIKEKRTQPKCEHCEHNAVCGHEATYLRISPMGIINPCLSMKQFDVPLAQFSDRRLFDKALSLGLRRVRSLDI